MVENGRALRFGLGVPVFFQLVDLAGLLLYLVFQRGTFQTCSFFILVLWLPVIWLDNDGLSRDLPKGRQKYLIWIPLSHESL
jgi:hypothetical protein